MVHLLSALIVGSIYGVGYVARGRKANLYKLSVVALGIFVTAVAVGFLLDGVFYGVLGNVNWSIFLYARQVVLYASWLQSLLCVALSIASFARARHWRYIAGGVFFAILYISIAYATSTQAIALTLR